MKGKLSAALWLIGCVIVSGIVVATLDVGFSHRIVDIHQSSDTSQGNSTLHSLALALSSGKEAMHRFNGHIKNSLLRDVPNPSAETAPVKD